MRRLLEGPGWEEMSEEDQNELLETSTCALLDASKTLLDYRSILNNPEEMEAAVKKCGELLPKSIVENTKPHKQNGKNKSYQTLEI